ncbi:hypothetical protein GCM10017687_19950 [Streptomyces echinatus]
MRYGQINLLLAVPGAVGPDPPPRRGYDRWTGVGLGLATAVKLTPALFPVFLLPRGSWTAAGAGAGSRGCGTPRGAAVAFAGATVLAAAVLPYDSWRFWTDMVFRASRVGQPEDTANQALRGVLGRLLHTPDPGALWTVCAAVVAVSGLAVAVRAELRGRRAWAVCACAITTLLISPVSWTHHWVWCVPLVVLLWSRGPPRGRPGLPARLLLVRPLVGAARHRPTGTAPDRGGLGAVGRLRRDRRAFPRTGPDIVAEPGRDRVRVKP